MNLWSYIAKRILLMLPTLFGVIAITFAVIQFVPGGPVEQALMELRKGQVGMGEASGGGASDYRGRQGVDAEQECDRHCFRGPLQQIRWAGGIFRRVVRHRAELGRHRAHGYARLS